MDRAQSLERFLEELASPVPVPGGGTAAALSGAIAAALLGMVAGIALGKAKGEEAEALKEARGEAEALSKDLHAQGEADAAAYEEVVAALRLPKVTEEEKARRRERIQAALKWAAEVPLTTTQKALAVLELAERLLPLSSRSTYSDLGVAVQLARAAALSALYNVDANCLAIQDEEFLSRLRPVRRRLEGEVQRKMAHLLTTLEADLVAWLGERDSNPH